MKTSISVDIFYIAIVIAANLGLLILVGQVAHNTDDADVIRIRQSKMW